MVPTNSEAADQLKALDPLDGGLKAYLAEADSDPKVKTSKINDLDSTSHVNQKFTPVHLPKISVFSGDHKVKPGEISFDSWKYEVSCLLQEGTYPVTSIAPAVRRSLRGQAAEIARFLGPQATIKQILTKLEQVYGTVESGAVLLQQVYLSKQEPHEIASTFGLRLQLLAFKCRERGGITSDAIDQTLKTIFWQGLHDESMKNALRHKYECIRSFDDVIKSVRTIEQETRECRAHMAEGVKKEKPLHKPAQTHQQAPAVPQNGNAQGGDISAALVAIMERLERLEQGGGTHDKKKAPPKKGSFNCFRCGQAGHIARGCRNEPTPEWTQRQLNGKGTLPGGKQ
ncbi:Paraneoplastic antigen Ma3-like [Holothuria leucospilota]|uniref:Paraneoplastic antigen Ma3-like n=1 Tax=Holothuria leucospilota TaxID=206669 RepID=A0A9Q1C9K1_HOLLE|nr:Paraneoplastic antigen Ma3-like [Holothuria leucospilota]